MDIAITFDVERNWHAHDGVRGPNFPFEYGFDMIAEAIPTFLDIADDYGVKFTFLVTGEVAREKADLIKRCLRKHEIGCHTHPYYHNEFKGRQPNDFYGSKLSEYTFTEQFSMIKKDTETIRRMIGIQPRSFRAGRLGINMETLFVLEKLGYCVDSSVKSARWSVPYHPSHINLRKFGDATLVEVPVSGFIGRKTVLTPRRIVEYQILSHFIFQPLLVMLCHPMEYADPHIDQDRAFRNFNHFIDFIYSKGAKFYTLTEVRQFVKRRSITNMQLRIMENVIRIIRKTRMNLQWRADSAPKLTGF
jgi:peptidoglycan/xylan/chitin deacetylase (PgdA/CDA1 family)